MTLREYQDKLYNDLRGCFSRRVKNPLVVSPTGSGKTVLFSYMANKLMLAGNSAIILVHRRELVTQTSSTLKAFSIPHGIIQAGISPDPIQLIQVAMVQTVARRLSSIKKPRIIIADEAHHFAAGTYGKIMQAFPDVHLVGFTATPERLDGKGLSDFFSEIVMGPSVGWLMENGFLSRARYFAPPVVADMRGVHRRGGDFAQDETAAAMDKRTVTGDAVKHYVTLGKSMPAIAFCVTIDHAKHVADQFNESGIPAATIHSKLSPDERKKVVRDLSTGAINVMTSCDIVSEGFDLPVVGVAILLRPTTSLGLHLQQIGRILRPYEGKETSVVLDHVGNLLRHGLAEDERKWSLEGRDKKAGKSESLNMLQCDQCFCLYSSRSRECPECGRVKPAPEPVGLQQVDGMLEEIIAMPLAKALGLCKTRKDLVALAKARGYKPGFAYYKAKELGIFR